MKILIKTARQANGAYRAWCPALPGCAVRAETRGRAQSKIGDAVVGYLASMDVALPREPDTNSVVEDVGLPDVPASPRGGSSATTAGSTATTGRDRGPRRKDCYART